MRAVPWRMTSDVAEYAERTWDLLASSPAEHTIPLSVLETVRTGHRWSDEPMLFGWFEDGAQVRGAVSMTPPYELLLAVVPEDTTEELVAALWAERTSLPGVNGDEANVDRFTPPEHRRRGYGTAITAACTADALDRGAQQVVLFTDLSNPTSNAIYQRIGYRPIGARRVVAFEDG